MIHTIEWKAMGCHMLAAGESDGERPPLIDETPGWFEEWEQVLSRFRPDSELCQLNGSAGRPFGASPVLWSVYQAALEAEELSGGLVTPTLLEALEQAGYTQSFDLPEEDGCQPAAPQNRHGVVTYPAGPAQEDSGNDRMITIPYGVRLDFGGVAKGWAAQKAVERLEIAGPALVDAGGDIAISGALEGGLPWEVGVENPFQPGTDLTALKLGRCGVATSGRDYRRWRQGGKWMHHIIDPRTGLPADTDALTATVIAPDVLQAEAAAKTVFILGSRRGIDWLQAHPALAGLLILEDGGYVYTRNFAEFLTAKIGQAS
jgi:thiamine biosynthesis lipoprotein